MSKTGWVLVSVAVLLLLWRGRWTKTTVILAIAGASATLAVGTGALHDIALRIVSGISAVSSKLTMSIFGVNLPWLIFLILAVIVILDFLRGASATNMTVAAAAIAIFGAAAIPGTAGDTISSVGSQIGSTVTTFFGAFFESPKGGWPMGFLDLALPAVFGTWAAYGVDKYPAWRDRVSAAGISKGPAHPGWWAGHGLGKGDRAIRWTGRATKEGSKLIAGDLRAGWAKTRQLARSGKERYVRSQLEREELMATKLVDEMTEPSAQIDPEFDQWCSRIETEIEKVHARATDNGHQDVADSMQVLLDRIRAARGSYRIRDLEEQEGQPADTTPVAEKSELPITTGGYMTETLPGPSGEGNTIGDVRRSIAWYEQVGAAGISTADQLVASMSGKGVDAETTGAVSQLIAAAEALDSAAKMAREVLDRNHGVLAEAVQSNPTAPAEIGFYEEG
jgi:hypothetical protein